MQEPGKYERRSPSTIPRVLVLRTRGCCSATSTTPNIEVTGMKARVRSTGRRRQPHADMGDVRFKIRRRPGRHGWTPRGTTGNGEMRRAPDGLGVRVSRFGLGVRSFSFTLSNTLHMHACESYGGSGIVGGVAFMAAGRLGSFGLRSSVFSVFVFVKYALSILCICASSLENKAVLNLALRWVSCSESFPSVSVSVSSCSDSAYHSLSSAVPHAAFLLVNANTRQLTHVR